MMKKIFTLLMILIFLAAATACAAEKSPQSATMPPGEWDYVVLGDSITTGYPEMYKTLIEEDYDGAVSITIKDWHIGGQTSSQLLQNIKTNEKMREDIRNAELITIEIPWAGCRGALALSLSSSSCGGEDDQDCLRHCLATYESDTTAIYAELVNLRSPTDALIRAHDVYLFHTSTAQEVGAFDVVSSYWQEGNAFVQTTAKSYGIPVANVYDAFMGEDGLPAPEENGLVGTDKIHTTFEGQHLIAELLHELGYERALR
jgi:lysophospholipase L1-like esterase